MGLFTKDKKITGQVITLNVREIDLNPNQPRKYFDKAEDTTGDDGKKYNFYGFYGVTKVAADIENATTTLNGGTLGST